MGFQVKENASPTAFLLTYFRSFFLSLSSKATKTKLRAELWKRQSIEDGGLFIKYFAVLEKGRLDFYLKEKVSGN